MPFQFLPWYVFSKYSSVSCVVNIRTYAGVKHSSFNRDCGVQATPTQLHDVQYCSDDILVLFLRTHWTYLQHKGTHFRYQKDFLSK